MTVTEMFTNVLLIAIIVAIIQLTNAYIKHLDRDDAVKETRILMAFEYKESKTQINKFLNSFLSDCMQDYILHNIMGDTGLTYISSDRETEIRNDVADLVSMRISPMIRKKISMYYNDSYFGTLLADKIYALVTMYVADFNSEKKDNINSGVTKKKAKIKIEELDPDLDW